MMLYELGFVLILLALFVIARTSKASTASAILIGLSLWNIPLLTLGNSAAAGIFPMDFGLLFVTVKFGLKYCRKIIPKKHSKAVYKIFLILAGYSVFWTCFALVMNDYGYYAKFLQYGIIRWVTFVLLFLFFCQKLTYIEAINLFKIIGWILLVYLTFAILHQFSIIDLSGLTEIGHGKMYQSKYYIKEVYRSYLGNNSASIGCVASVGILLSLLLAGYARWKRKAELLFTVGVIALINSGSRTDSVTILICCFAALIFPRSIFARFLTTKMVPIFLVVITFAWLAGGHSVQIPGIDRLSNTDFIGEYQGISSGTFAYRQRQWEIAKTYLCNNSAINLLGFGVNGYRLLSVKGYGTMGYGHNVFLHTWVELGVIGLTLLLLWLISLLHYLVFLIRNNTSFIKDITIITLVFFMQRIMSGITIDTFFATDNMLTMNAFVLFFFGLIYSFSLQQREKN